MAMFAMMVFRVLSTRVVSGEGKRNSESSHLLSRLVACSLHEQTERANDDPQRGKVRDFPHSLNATHFHIELKVST